MQKPNLSVNIPFEGFYESKWSVELDRQAESFCENEADYREEENGIPLPLRLSQEEYADIIFDCSDFKKMEQATVKTYVDAFGIYAKEELGFDLGLTFEEMTSPEFYNFETDRIFCEIPRASVAKLFRLSRADKHATLEREIKERFTSYDGFCSFYPNNLANWLAKPLHEWDHNELGTLLRAMLYRDKDEREESWRVYEITADCDSLYHEWESGIDWAKFETLVAEKREEKRAELGGDGIPVPHCRCPDTLDLFKDYRA